MPTTTAAHRPVRSMRRPNDATPDLLPTNKGRRCESPLLPPPPLLVTTAAPPHAQSLPFHNNLPHDGGDKDTAAAPNYSLAPSAKAPLAPSRNYGAVPTHDDDCGGAGDDAAANAAAPMQPLCAALTMDDAIVGALRCVEASVAGKPVQTVGYPRAGLRLGFSRRSLYLELTDRDRDGEGAVTAKTTTDCLLLPAANLDLAADVMGVRLVRAKNKLKMLLRIDAFPDVWHEAFQGLGAVDGAPGYTALIALLEPSGTAFFASTIVEQCFSGEESQRTTAMATGALLSVAPEPPQPTAVPRGPSHAAMEPAVPHSGHLPNGSDGATSRREAADLSTAPPGPPAAAVSVTTRVSQARLSLFRDASTREVSVAAPQMGRASESAARPAEPSARLATKDRATPKHEGDSTQRDGDAEDDDDPDGGLTLAEVAAARAKSRAHPPSRAGPVAPAAQLPGGMKRPRADETEPVPPIRRAARPSAVPSEPPTVAARGPARGRGRVDNRQPPRPKNPASTAPAALPLAPPLAAARVDPPPMTATTVRPSPVGHLPQPPPTGPNGADGAGANDLESLLASMNEVVKRTKAMRAKSEAAVRVGIIDRIAQLLGDADGEGLAEIEAALNHAKCVLLPRVVQDIAALSSTIDRSCEFVSAHSDLLDALRRVHADGNALLVSTSITSL